MTHLKGNFINKVTATTGVDQYQRVLIVYDKQTNGSAFGITDLLNSVGTYALQNLSYLHRFEILLDRRFYLNDYDEPGSAIVWGVDMPLRHPVQFNTGTDGTVADITTGSVYVVSIGSEAAGATAGQLTGSVRISFADA